MTITRAVAGCGCGLAGAAGAAVSGAAAMVMGVKVSSAEAGPEMPVGNEKTPIAATTAKLVAKQRAAPTTLNMRASLMGGLSPLAGRMPV